ncbi:MAG: RNA methyltransferase [Bacteroidales bacterium]|nr:RNA methyltransferase [Bacteroidales bacterium]
MIGKGKISSITRLHQKKFRDESGLFLVEGIKSVSDLLRSSFAVEEVLATDVWIGEHEHEVPVNAELTLVTPAEMERLSTWKTPQPVMAVVQIPERVLSDIRDDQPMLILDDLRDPGNMGTIVRTADWFGIRQIVCSKTTVELYNPKVIQATMGSFTRVKVYYTDLVEYIDKNVQGKRVLGAFLEGTPVQQFSFQSSDVIVIGNEANGITAPVAKKISSKILIDSPVNDSDKAESLNASVAAAILMYQYSISVRR